MNPKDGDLIVQAEVYDPVAEAWVRFVIEDPIVAHADPATRVRYWENQRAVIAGGWEVRDVHVARRRITYERVTPAKV